jgi:hypothetical protein
MATAGAVFGGLMAKPAKRVKGSSGKKKTGIAALTVAAVGASAALIRRRGKKHDSSSSEPLTTTMSPVETKNDIAMSPGEIPRP